MSTSAKIFGQPFRAYLGDPERVEAELQQIVDKWSVNPSPFAETLTDLHNATYGLMHAFARTVFPELEYSALDIIPIEELDPNQIQSVEIFHTHLGSAHVRLVARREYSQIEASLEGGYDAVHIALVNRKDQVVYQHTLHPAHYVAMNDFQEIPARVPLQDVHLMLVALAKKNG